MSTNFGHQHFPIETFRVRKPALAQLLAKKVEQAQSKELHSSMKQSQFYRSISGEWLNETSP